MSKTKSAFTLVELLIVIVIIAILAAISLVAYNAITNRANDSAVQSDLSDAAKALEMYKADNNSYPNSPTLLAAMKSNGQYVLHASTSSYKTGASVNNYVYCYNSTDPSIYGLASLSLSGNAFYVSSTQLTPKAYSSWNNSGSVNCPAINSSLTSWAWGYNAATWATSWLSTQ